MIDRGAIGEVTGCNNILIERGRLQFFARVTSQSDPIYSDVDAARATGHRDLPVPPTLMLGFETETGDLFSTLDRLNIDLRNVLHGEQGFTYHQMAYAGDLLQFETRIADIYSKKEGQLEFIVRHTKVTRGADHIADLRSVMVVVQQQGGRT